MNKRRRELVITLKRANSNVPWGFSVIGGADINTPITVTRVGYGTPAANSLQRGDIITKINNYDSRDIRQQDARNLFKTSNNEIKIAVQREQPYGGSAESSLHSSHTYSPSGMSPNLSPRSGTDYSRGGSALTPTQGAPFEEMIDYDFGYLPSGKISGKSNRHNLDVHVDKQPYRTTPLVLPGAKIKREQGPTESYLRHHPNPSVRAPPTHLETENILKQKVVHKQFNSPIGLYSESAIADTIQKQTGLQAARRPVKYDPTKSEIYKAIQEEQLGDKYQEVNVPPQTKIYVPHKVDVSNKKPYYSTSKQNDISQFGVPSEKIIQSNSFRRLMLSVLPETDF